LLLEKRAPPESSKLIVALKTGAHRKIQLSFLELSFSASHFLHHFFYLLFSYRAFFEDFDENKK
jgi:hypothetical protein